MSEELKPCPFCGNELLRLRGEDSHYVRIHCDSCFADWKMEYSTIRAESSELTRLRAEVEELRKDKERLDWLDQVNAKRNADNGTVYGWKFEQNHLRSSLTDHHYKPAHVDVRTAITAAMKRQP